MEEPLISLVIHLGLKQPGQESSSFQNAYPNSPTLILTGTRSPNCVPEFVSKGDRKSVPLQQTLEEKRWGPSRESPGLTEPGSSRYGGPRESVTAQPRSLLQTWALFLLHVPVTHNQFLLLPILHGRTYIMPKSTLIHSDEE